MKLVVIVPHRARLPQLRHHLRSLAWQTRPPDQVIVSCHGDTVETRREIVGLLEEHIDSAGIPKQLWAVGELGDPWRKPLAINWAIRRTAEDVDVIATLDVDCILHPEMLEQVELAFEERENRYVMCPNLSLPKDLNLNGMTYEQMRSKAFKVQWKGRRGDKGPPFWGWGALAAAPREWWFKVRGLDEDMQWWGSEDEDLAKRASVTGLKWYWIPRRFAFLHQWHEAGQKSVPEAAKWIKKNHITSFKKMRKREIVRNPDGWGGLP